MPNDQVKDVSRAYHVYVYESFNTKWKMYHVPIMYIYMKVLTHASLWQIYLCIA